MLPNLVLSFWVGVFMIITKQNVRPIIRNNTVIQPKLITSITVTPPLPTTFVSQTQKQAVDTNKNPIQQPTSVEKVNKNTTSTTNNNLYVSFVALPKNTYQKGESIEIEVIVSDQSQITKVSLGIASGLTSKDFGYIVDTKTQAPYKFFIRVPQNTYISNDNKVYITAHAYKKDGSSLNNTINLNVIDSNLSIQFIKPSSDQIFKANDNVEVEVTVAAGESTKAEFYIGSGMLLQTLTSQPYSFQFNLDKYTQGISANQRIPFSVRVYNMAGDYVYTDRDLNVIPANSQPTPYPTNPASPISSKTKDFIRGVESGLINALGNITYTIERYDSFTNTSLLEFKGEVNNLKPESDYELFASTKNGNNGITTIHTNSNGYGTFNVKWGFQSHYCDVYTIGIHEKNSDYNKADLWGQEIDDVCPRG